MTRHQGEKCPRCEGPKHEPVCGLTAGCFHEVREALKLSSSPRKDFAIRCLEEIACQITVVVQAKDQAERDFHEIWEKAEAARHKAYQAHIDFGGVLYEEKSP